MAEPKKVGIRLFYLMRLLSANQAPFNLLLLFFQKFVIRDLYRMRENNFHFSSAFVTFSVSFSEG